MKKKFRKSICFMLACSVLALLLVSCRGHSIKTVLNPDCDSISEPRLSVDKVILTDSMTIIDFSYVYGDDGGYIFVPTSTFIEADGKKYKLIGTKNVYTVDKTMEFIHDRIFTYSLIFEPVPTNVKTIDYHENENPNADNAWSIIGIHLDKERSTIKYDGLEKSQWYERRIDSLEAVRNDAENVSSYNSGSYGVRRTSPYFTDEYIYCCLHCHEVVEATQAEQPRPNSGNCVSGFHQWACYGKVGNNTYECSECGMRIHVSGSPMSDQGCTVNNMKQHRWRRVY